MRSKGICHKLFVQFFSKLPTFVWYRRISQKFRRSNRIFKSVAKAGTLLIFITLLITVGKYILANLYIKRVIIISQPTKIYGLEVLNNKTLFFLDGNYLRDRIIKSNPLIKDVIIEKKFPSTLILKLQMRQPIAYIRDPKPYPFQIVYLDGDGVLFFNKNLTTNFPQIEMRGKLETHGSKPDWRMRLLADIIKSFSQQSIFVDQLSVDLQSGLIDMVVNDEINIKTNFEINPYALTGSLQVILHRFRIEGKKIRQVSFLQDKPIVILESGEKISSM